MAHTLRSGAALVLALSIVSIARAKPPEPADPYEAARDAETQLNYKAVLTYATRALDVAQSHERLVNLYQMLGTANAVLGKYEAAVDAFTKLLAIDPEHKLPRGTSPKINGPYKEAGGYWLDRPGGLAMTPTLPRDMAAAKPLTVPVKLDDPLNLTATVRVNYRLAGDPEFAMLETPAAPQLTFNIPAEAIAARKGDYALELYFTALSAKGSELRLVGTAAAPMTVTVHGIKEPDLISPVLIAPPIERPARHKPTFYKKWWFWTAVGGVVVVAAALGGGLGAYYSRDTAHVDLNLSSRTGP